MKLLWRKLKMIPFTVFPGYECPQVIWLQFLYYFYVHSQPCSHNLQNIVRYIYLFLFSTLWWPLDAGFCLWENAVGELELLSGQQNISQRWSNFRLYGPLHVYHLPGYYCTSFSCLASDASVGYSKLLKYYLDSRIKRM